MRNSKKIVASAHGNPMNLATKNRGLRALLLGAASLLAVSGCVNDSGEGDAGQDLEARRTGLVAFDTCDDLLGYFQAEAVSDLELGFGYGYGTGVALGAPESDRAFDDAQAGAAPEAPTSGNEGGSGESAGPGFSGTNVQESGVDEPDLVKTDGRFIYAVRNGHLVTVQADNLSQQSDVALDFNAYQMLLSGNQVLVLGDRWDAPVVAGVELPAAQQYRSRVVAALYDIADRTAPRLLRTMYIDGGLAAARLTGRVARLVVHHDPSLDLGAINVPGGIEPDAPPVAEPGYVPPEEVPPGVPEDATPAEPQADEISAADAGAGEDPYQAWLDAAKAQIAATDVDAWIPQIIDVSADGQGTLRRAAACGQFYRPGERSGLGTTVVVSLDLDQPGATLPDPALVTATGTVYASGENLYLATVNWRDFIAPMMAEDMAPGVSGGGSTGSAGSSSGSTGAATTGGETPPELPAMESAGQAQAAPDALDAAAEPDDREATQIHKLSLPVGGAAQYVASGRVHGQLLSQFSLSEYQGHLRVAATEHATNWFGGGGVRGGDVAVAAPAGTATSDAPAANDAPAMERAQQPQAVEQPRSVTRVSVLDENLTAVGQTADVAPNEEIYAVRFLADRGFVVTFERTDPLFTIDLSTPSAPRIVGELEVLGYSTYLHPVDENHLLGLGRSADENGIETGMQLSLFDVTDMASPALDASLLLGEGWTDASYDHHALTFYEGMLMLPVSAWTAEGGVDGIEVFGVDVDDGIVRRGAIDHSGFAGEAGYAHVERSLVIGDVIYSLSNAALVASRRDDLTEIGHVMFPQPANDGGGETKPGDPGEPVPADADPDQRGF